METSKAKEPAALGIPYHYQGPTPSPPPVNVMHPPAPPYEQHPPPYYYQHQYHVAENPYQAGMVPPNAIVADPKGVPIHQTFFRDTPAPFHCVFCSNSGLTVLRSKPSLAAVVGCMMPFFMGFCFLCSSMDCLWHKYHYCPSCGQEVAEFEKSDPCMVMDPPNWTQPSFALTS